MRSLFLLFLALASLFSADIDVKLFEAEDKKVYYDEIKKKIDIDANKKLRAEDIIKDEIIHLSRLRDAASQKVQIDKYDLNILTRRIVKMPDYYTAVNAAATLGYKHEQNSKMINDIQSKLLFLRQSIERITEEEKPKLLSYQLQFAYYKLQQKNIESKLVLLKEHSEEILKALLKALPLIKCEDKEHFDKTMAEYDKNMEDVQKSKISQQLLREKAIIEESAKIETITKKIEAANSSYEEILGEKIALLTKHSICMVKEKNNNDFYKTLKDIESLVSDLSVHENKMVALEQIDILKDISKERFGATKLFFGATLQESKDMLLSFKEFFVSPLFIFNERPISLFSLFKALLLIAIGFFMGVMYKRWVVRMSRRWSDLSMMSVRLASNIGYYLIVVIFLIIAISSLGIDMSSISLIAGALSIGIGFGLQTVVSNLIAGIILMFERTIRIGDTVEISDVLFGTVTDMRIRSTTIKTFDNIDIVVPNSSFIQNNVINWTLEDRVRRLHIPFSVAYDTEVDDVKKAVLGALEASDLHYVRNNDDRKPDIRMTQMNSSSVDFELYVWVEWNVKLKNVSFKSDFLILIYNALRANNIKIPFPQLDVYMKQTADETKKSE